MAAPRVARCPACNEPREVDSQRALRMTELAWFAKGVLAQGLIPGGAFFPLRDGMRQLALRETGKWFWACDDCIASKKAVVASPGKQHLGVGTPFAAYVDRPFRCEDCGTDTVFGAREQEHWFETLRFLIWVYPKQCTPCRFARRARAKINTELADALHGLDASDPVQLEALARLYDQLGSEKKAAVLRARARNRRASKPKG